MAGDENSLPEVEMAFRDLASALGKKLREVREERGMRLWDMAQALGMRRARLTFLENAHPFASLDSQIRTLLALGVSRSELARIIAGPAS